MLLFRLSLSLIISSSLFIIASGSLPQSQIDSLRQFYDSLNGDRWTNCTWDFSKFQTDDSLSNLSICGLTIKQKEDSETVTELEFIQKNLNGTLDGSVFAALPDLEKIQFIQEPLLNLSFPDICSLSNLWYINIEANLSGTVPHCIGSMWKIKKFGVGCPEYHCPLVFDDTIIGMWCENGNNIMGLEFDGIDYRLSDMMCFVSIL